MFEVSMWSSGPLYLKNMTVDMPLLPANNNGLHCLLQLANCLSLQLMTIRFLTNHLVNLCQHWLQKMFITTLY